MTKLQITLTPEETMSLSYGASSLGYSLTKFVKFILGQKAMEFNKKVSSYQLSNKAISNLRKSMKDYNEGKFTEVKSLMDLTSVNETKGKNITKI